MWSPPVPPDNGALQDYFERERWNCPVHACIRAFDIMVPEAIHQGVQWHMWLYYIPIFVEKILDNVDPAPEVELWREWPTPYHYLLYACLDALCDWLDEAASVPAEAANVAVVHQDLRGENGSIAKSAALATGQALRHMLLAANLPLTFKAYVLQMALNSAIACRDHRREDLAAVLRDSIAKGGSWQSSNDRYRAALVGVLGNVDRLFVERLRGDDALGGAAAEALG